MSGKYERNTFYNDMRSHVGYLGTNSKYVPTHI